MRRLLALISVAVVGVVAGLFISSASAVPVAHSTTIATFSDSVGEVPGGPDVSTVTVSLDGNVLTVEGQVAGMPELTSDGAVMFILNTDSNPTTGSLQGADYVIVFDTKTLQGGVMRWDGSDYVPAEQVADPARTLVGAGSAGFMMNLANLGSPKHIEFAMIVLKGSADAGLMDVAPDGGLWAFDAVAPTPAPPTTTTPTPTPTPTPVVVKPVISSPTATPPAALAGKRMTVTFRVTRNDNRKPLLSGRMVCDPSVAGKVIRHSESFKAGTARLSFLVPKTAKGKLLKVKLTIKAGAKSTTRIATYRVR